MSCKTCNDNIQCNYNIPCEIINDIIELKKSITGEIIDNKVVLIRDSEVIGEISVPSIENTDIYLDAFGRIVTGVTIPVGDSNIFLDSFNNIIS